MRDYYVEKWGKPADPDAPAVPRKKTYEVYRTELGVQYRIDTMPQYAAHARMPWGAIAADTGAEAVKIIAKQMNEPEDHFQPWPRDAPDASQDGNDAPEGQSE